MTERGAHGKAEDGHGGVAVALAGKDELAQRAAAQKDAAEAGQGHAEEVPDGVVVGHGLALEAQVEVGVAGGGGEHEVGHQGTDEDGAEAHEELGLAEENHVADAANHAEAGALGQGAYDDAGSQGDGDGGVLGARGRSPRG